VTIEDAAELQLQQIHVARLETRPPNVEGRGAVTATDLVKNALRMRPDRVIIGECRGAETLDMVQAMNTGHEGSMATVHANSSDDAIMRLETLASMSEIKIPFEALRDQINNAVDVVVQLSRSADGSRRVSEVAAVASRRREDFRLATLCHYQPDPLAADRVVRGRFLHHPLPRALADRLVLRGESVPPPFPVAQVPSELLLRGTDE
jgi:pilus assembly protein CpaF